MSGVATVGSAAASGVATVGSAVYSGTASTASYLFSSSEPTETDLVAQEAANTEQFEDLVQKGETIPDIPEMPEIPDESQPVNQDVQT